MTLESTHQLFPETVGFSNLSAYEDGTLANHSSSNTEEVDNRRLASWLKSVAEEKDKVSFGHLFDFLAPRIKGFLRRSGTLESHLDDLTQEVMLKIWRYAGRFDPAKGKVTTWVFTITRNVRIDMIRKENRPEPDMNDPYFVTSPPAESDEIIFAKQTSSSINAAIDSLPHEQREILKYAFYEEKSHAEIASNTGLPLGTVKSRIRLAFNRLKKSLTEHQI